MEQIYTKARNYQGILQLRPFNKQVYDFVLRQIKGRNDCFITKEESRKEGIDLYITSNQFLIALGKRLKKAFKGTTKVSRTLHTRDRQTSKRVFRVTLCFRLEQ